MLRPPGIISSQTISFVYMKDDMTQPVTPQLTLAWLVQLLFRATLVHTGMQSVAEVFMWSTSMTFTDMQWEMSRYLSKLEEDFVSYTVNVVTGSTWGSVYIDIKHSLASWSHVRLRVWDNSSLYSARYTVVPHCLMLYFLAEPESRQISDPFMYS